MLIALNFVFCSFSGNPLSLFDEFWQVFDDHYAFFELRNMNWAEQRKIYRPKVNASTTDDELFTIFSQMVDPLGDGHVSISADGKYFKSKVKPAWLVNSAEIQSLINEKYLKNETHRKGKIVYGMLDKVTGYININSMEGYDAADIDEATQFLKSVKKIIIDVRFNGGGYDTIALALAGRFTDQKRFVYSKETYFKGRYGEHRDLYIKPEGTILIPPKIVVLTSRATASAAEMFVMAMRAIPSAIILGENTNGMHSDVMVINLSNGWRLGLSNQKYMLPDGKVYEKIGLPPHKSAAMNDILTEKKDAILETALTL